MMTTAAPAVEHTGRGPLATDERAARIARDIPAAGPADGASGSWRRTAPPWPPCRIGGTWN
ncbi:hypothetical protein HFP71_08700 [Streptomyces sp. ARC32]